MRKCNICNISLEDMFQYCPKCGGKTEEIAQCTGCGEELFADDLFCPKCGEKRTIVNNQESFIPSSDKLSRFSEPETQRDTKFFISIGLVIILTVVAAIGWVAFGQERIELQTANDLKQTYWNQYTSAQSDYQELKTFMDHSVVIVPEGSRTYHKYGCSELAGITSYYIYNPENAAAQGYHECSICGK
jgi:hypothetical protein